MNATEEYRWVTHPSGIRSRALPDEWSPFDQSLGFSPPFTVDVWDHGSLESIAVLDHVHRAAQKASREARHRGARNVEINDRNGQQL